MVAVRIGKDGEKEEILQKTLRMVCGCLIVFGHAREIPEYRPVKKAFFRINTINPAIPEEIFFVNPDQLNWTFTQRAVSFDQPFVTFSGVQSEGR
jgi:hypothetical protein